MKTTLDWRPTLSIRKPHRPPISIVASCGDIGLAIDQDPCGGFRLTRYWPSGARRYVPTNFKTLDDAKRAAEHIVKQEGWSKPRCLGRQ
jgi:hypothetical protein